MKPQDRNEPAPWRPGNVLVEVTEVQRAWPMEATVVGTSLAEERV